MTSETNPPATGTLRLLAADVAPDLRHAGRMFRKSPAFTVAAIAIPAVAIGGTVSVATLLDTLYFRLTFVCVAALIVFVALAACYVPARRATLIDPLVALRVD